MPDALTKTIPIWCVVINRLLFENTSTAHQLCTPKNVVGPSEHAQIEARLETLVEDAKVITNFDSYRNIFLADLLVSASRYSFPTFNPKETHSPILGHPGDFIIEIPHHIRQFQSNDLLYRI